MGDLKYNYTTGNYDEVKMLEDPDSILWKETRLGFIPRRCFITNKWLWPYTKVGMKGLTYVAVGRSGMWHRLHFAKLSEAMFENLKVKQ